MDHWLKNRFSLITRASVLASSMLSIGVSSAADQLTISSDDLLQNDGVLKFSMESGATVFNAKCTLDELSVHRDVTHVTCNTGIYFGSQNIAITGRQGNEKAVNLDGERYQSSKAMKVQYSFNSSGLLVDLDILEGAKPRFASHSWDRAMYEVTDESINSFNDAREQKEVDVEDYALESPNLTPIEQALQEGGASFYSSSVRPLDDLYFIQESSSAISQTNVKIVGGEDGIFDVDKQTGSLAVSITRAYNDEGQYGKVKTTISFHGIVADGGMTSTSFSFDKDMGALPNDQINYQVDKRKEDLLREAAPADFIVTRSLAMGN